MHPLQQTLSPHYRLEGLPHIRDVIYHCQAGVLVWPQQGILYGRKGAPIGHACRRGYVRVALGNPRYQYAHRLVWEVVHGPIPPGIEIDHGNGRKGDNRLANLDAVTREENLRRGIERGQILAGIANPLARLNDDLVCQIRASTRTARDWAEELGVDQTTVAQARRRVTWRHVECRGAKPIRHRRGRRKPSPGAAS